MRAVDSSAGTATTVWSGQLNRFLPYRWPGVAIWASSTSLNSVAGGFSTRYAQVDVATHSATEITLHDIVTAQVVPSPRQYYVAIASRTNGPPCLSRRHLCYRRYSERRDQRDACPSRTSSVRSVGRSPAATSPTRRLIPRPGQLPLRAPIFTSSLWCSDVTASSAPPA